MKYVAFLDILGFKNKLKNQTQAIHYISDFSSTIYLSFYKHEQDIDGYIVSDSVILSTNNAEPSSLHHLINLIDEICKNEFSQNGILSRGGISKGEFDRMPAEELQNLRKSLMVGEAYVNAYLLEDSVKNIGINVSSKVYQDLLNINETKNIINEQIGKNTHYIFRYLTLDFLLDPNNISRFVRLAKESDWIPHYYNALYFALINETNDKKIEQFFVNIENLICDNNPSENWRELDKFIKNAFAGDVLDNFQKRMLKHIRQKLF